VAHGQFVRHPGPSEACGAMRRLVWRRTRSSSFFQISSPGNRHLSFSVCCFPQLKHPCPLYSHDLFEYVSLPITSDDDHEVENEQSMPRGTCEHR